MTQDTLAARLQAELERERQGRVSEFGADALAWLAFPPVWNDRLARACDFPERPLRLEELLERAEAVGWCVRQETETHVRTPALRLRIQVEVGELTNTPWQVTLREIGAAEDELLEARLLAKWAPVAPPDAVPAIHAAARQIGDPVAAADVMLAIASRDREHAESVRLYLRGLLDQITDPDARASRMVRFRELTVVQAWRREFLEFLSQVRDPILAARLLKDAAKWLPEEDVSARVEDLAGAVPAFALGDLAAAAAWAGWLEQAMRIAQSVRDRRAMVHAYAELLVPVSRAGDQGMLRDLVRRCVDESRLSDPVSMAKVVESLASARLAADAEQLAFRLLQSLRGERATSVQIAALQRAAAAVLPLQAGETGLSLVRRSAELAAQLADPTQQAAFLGDAVALAQEFDLPYPLDTTPLVQAARAIHDKEDRVQALARAAALVGGREGRQLTGEALSLAGSLEDYEGAPLVTFWAPDGARAEILEALRRQHGFGWIQEITATIGAQILAARAVRDNPAPIPAALARWAELAAADAATTTRGRGGSAAAGVLDDRVKRLLGAGDTSQALAWLDTAKSLSPLLLGDFETSVIANTRRVELVHRREQDRKRLAEFLPRAGQIRAFEQLLDRDEEGGRWALHYLGVGGVGKTTLIRYLTTQLAPERGVVTSRIDFDHINPDYPRRRPAQLLLELATELQAHAQDRREITLFEKAYEQLMEINAAALPGAAPITVSDPRFARAVRTFDGFLQALEQQVVLILDTCEELEKFQPVSGRIEQLEATFAIIEALHEVVPRLRVVLAGRRPLARSGNGWRLADRDDEARALLPAEKPYLLVHEVRGFDRAEAEEFLGPGPKGLDLSPALLDAILARSPDPGTAAPLERTATRVAEAPDGPCYNPFDLDHYANWLRSEPSLTANDVASRKRDVYVESRIIGRLRRPDAEHADLERLLPAVTALGRFEREMLRPAFDGDDGAFADTWRELTGTEWTDLQFDAALDVSFLEVDRGLRPRLEAYYRRPEHRGLHQEAARRLGPGLARLVDERPLGRLGVDHVAAALRLLPPAECARLVERLSWKVIETGAWGWAERVTERVLADQPDLGSSEHPAAASLWVLLAGARTHLDPGGDHTDLWQSAEAAALVGDQAELDAWLRWRALLAQGEVISGPRLTKSAQPTERVQLRIFDELAEETDERRRQVLLGGLLAAVANKLDEAEADEHVTFELDPDALETAVLTEPPAVRGFARVLSARAFLLNARFDEAERMFAEAVALATQPSPTPSPWLCADWEPPEDLERRVWLEALRAPIKEVGPPSLGPPPIPEGRLGGIDADRFASAALLRRLARGVVPAEELSVYERFEDLLEVRQPVCQAHRAVPPFFIAVARGWIVLGEGERARSLLLRGDEAAVASRDPVLVKLTNLARMEVVRRFRSVGRDGSLREQMLRSGDPEERVAAEWAQTDADVMPKPSVDATTERAPSLTGWLKGHPMQWEQGVHVVLYDLALKERPSVDVLRTLESLFQVVGSRRVAELILEVGGRSASGTRRLDGAATLLDVAAELFRSSDDQFGAFSAVAMAAMARVQAGAIRAESIPRLEGAYEELRRERVPALPSWNEVQTFSGRLGDAFQDQTTAAWAGWLMVLLLFTGRPTYSERPTDAGDVRRRRSILPLLAVAAVGVLVGVLASGTVQSVPMFGLGAGAAEEGSAWLTVTWLLIDAAAGLLLVLGWRPARAWLHRRRLGGRTRVTLPDQPSVGFAPYEQQQEVLTEPIRRVLGAADPERGVALHLESGRESPAWEAPVLLAVGDVGAPCWRPRQSLQVTPRRRVLRRVRCFALASPTWSSVLGNLDSRTRGELVGPVGVQPGEPVAGTSPVPSGDALVLLGTPVETSAGLRLRVSSVTAKGTAPEDYVEPDTLGLEGSAFGLVVVMGEPSESLTRIDAEREQAADLRHVAADLMNAGAPMVLCLPAMPPGLAGDVLAILGRHLRRIRAYGPWELVRASTRIRRKLASAGATDAERAGARELALDVTVWIRP